MLRRPSWARRVGVSCPGARVTEGAEWLRIEKTWHKGDCVHLSFDFSIRLDPYANGEFAVCRGPLQYALPVAARRVNIASHAKKGFHDLDLEPEDLAPAYRLPVLDSLQPDCGFVFQEVEGTDPLNSGPGRRSGSSLANCAYRPWDRRCCGAPRSRPAGDSSGLDPAAFAR